jgi:hypothetical protein
MPRPRQRACLQDGLRLDLNRLAQRGFICPGAATGPVGIKWTDGYSGEVKASAIISADERPTRRMVPYPKCQGRWPGSANCSSCSSAPFRRQAMVFHLSVHAALCDGAVAATGGPFLCLPAALAPPGCLRLTISWPRGPGASRAGKNQIPPVFDWPLRS